MTAFDWVGAASPVDEPGDSYEDLTSYRPGEAPTDLLSPGDAPADAVEPEYPDASFVTSKRTARGAKKYQDQVKALMNIAIRSTAEHPATVADSAALLMYGPKLTVEMGNLAVKSDRVAAMLDMLDGGVENPYVAVYIAAAPLLLQMIRNHEPVLEPARRTIKIPFIKREIPIPIKVGIRLGGLRAATHDPRTFAHHIFDQPDVQARMTKEKINVALYRERETGQR